MAPSHRKPFTVVDPFSGRARFEARKTADRLTYEACNKRMLRFQGPAQPSPALGDAFNAGYLHLEVKCWAVTPTRPCR
jgi:hypothetical protein